MFKQRPFPFSLLILVILIALHSVGSAYSWYWLYPWFDILVHVVSGLWIALLFLWLASSWERINSLKNYKTRIFLIAFFSAILIGIIWEVMEVFFKITVPNSPSYILDTAGDILSGAFGGVLAYWYFIKRRKRLDKSISTLHPFYNQAGVIKN